MKFDVFVKILNLQSVIPGLTRNPVLSVSSGCRIRSGMTKEEFLEDRQNFITQVSFSIKLAAFQAGGWAEPGNGYAKSNTKGESSHV
jgi:hypothetical protein